MRNVGLLSLDDVKQPSRSGDYDMGSLAQIPYLAHDRGSAVKRNYPYFLLVFRIIFQILGYLSAKLPCRRQHKHLRRLVGSVEIFEDRQAESGGLPRTCLCQTYDIIVFY